MNSRYSTDKQICFKVAFDALPLEMQQVISHIHNNTGGASPRLILASLLGFMSTTCQSGYDIKLPHGAYSPLSLYLLSIAPSGTKKSAVQLWFTNLIKQHEKLVQERLKENVSRYKTLNTIWSEQLTYTEKRLKKAIAMEDEKTITDCKNTLINLYEQEPIAIKPYRAICTDITRMGLLRSLANKNNHATIFTSEASVFIKELPKLCSDINAIWSGEDVNIERADEKNSIKLADARLTINAMIQDGALQEKLFGSDQTKDSGFFGRLLLNHVSNSNSNYGLQQISKDEDEQAWSNFSERGLSLYQHSEAQFNSCGKRHTLEFSTDAISETNTYVNYVRDKLSNGYFHDADIGSFVEKLDNHVSRIAGLLKLYFQDFTSLIVGADMVKVATKILDYYLDEQVYFFDFDGDLFLFVKLKNWFEKQFNLGRNELSRTYILQNVTPHKLRDAKLLDRLLHHVQNEGVISIRYYYGQVFYCQPPTRNPTFLSHQVTSPSRPFGRDWSAGMKDKNF